ncbi:MAG: LacI family DNA-binding transcriptional regulator [Novosphingobium sp.]
MSKLRRQPTSYDVAMLAGVSQSAVSRCFRPGSSIAPETRAKVMAAAKALNYRPNAIASGLITKRSGLVAVIISNLTNLYYPDVLSELTRRLSDAELRVLLFALDAESDVDGMLDQVWRFRVDGAIVAARLSTGQLREFGANGVPVVLYNRTGESEPVPSICCDSLAGERQLIDRLCESGHRGFGIIGGPQDNTVSRDRVRGAQARLAALGLESTVVTGAFDYQSGKRGMIDLHEQLGRRLDAVICANDLMAIGAIDAARGELALNVPADVSIVGFDGVGPGQWDSYQLTTVRQPVRRMTQAAVEMLAERIADPALPPETRSFAGQLIAGRTARAHES